jgi:hypothetical protein
VSAASETPGDLTPQEIARRLIRSRNWHLVEAARCRQRRLDLVDTEMDHEQEAQRIADQVRALGFDPQPPMGPRSVA